LLRRLWTAPPVGLLFHFVVYIQQQNVIKREIKEGVMSVNPVGFETDGYSKITGILAGAFIIAATS
jgi:hypothetical protein